MRSVLVALAVCLLAPAAASAATANVISVYENRGTAYKVTYHAAAGEANELTVTRAPGSLALTDPGAEIEPGEGCAPAGDHSVVCTHPEGLGLWARLGDEEDRFENDGPGFQVHGGPGDDVLAGAGVMDGGDGDDVLTAGERSTWFWGGDGADTMTGSDRYDQFVGGPGPDKIDGKGEFDPLGFSADLVSYEDHHAPVTVDLSKPGSPAGSEGEGDVLTDIESVAGGHGPDRLTARKEVSANGFGSAMGGLGGDDLIRGGPGRDGLGGGGGDDTLRSGGGDDRLDGGPGRDALIGGGGLNEIWSFEGRSERDSVRCGEAGTVYASTMTRPLLDVLDQSCGSVTFSDFLMQRLEYDYSRLSAGVLGVNVGCLRRCRVALTLSSHGAVGGGASRVLRAEQRTTLHVPLGTRAHEALERDGALKVRFSMDVDWGARLRHRESTHWFLMLHASTGARR